MHTYAATYITGLGELVQNALEQDIPDMKIIGSDDGLLVFQSAESFQQIRNISYVNTLFACLSYEENGAENKSVHAIVKALAQKTGIPHVHGKTFRVMVMQGSKLEHVTKEIATKLKDKIARFSGLTFSPLKADVEFWVLVRTNGAVMFGFKKEDYEAKPSLQKGELKPEMAELLVMASHPQAEDVFLDPFAGYGSIPNARLNLEPSKKIILCEKKGQLVEGLKRRFKQHKEIFIHQTDSLKMEFLGNESVDAIVTDPPWGMYEEVELDMPVFYGRMLHELARVLNQTGRMVILTGQPEALKDALTRTNELQLAQEYPTLVNGKKATIFIIVKSAVLSDSAQELTDPQ